MFSGDKKKAKQPAVWRPPGFDVNKSYALQAVAEGRADEGQQKEAIQYIVTHLCGLNRDPCDVDNAYASYRNMGQQSVGRAINHIVTLNLSVIKEMEKN